MDRGDKRVTRAKIRRTRTPVLLALTLVVLLAVPASAGTVVGKVTLRGEAPAPETFAVGQDTGVCGTEKQTADLVVGDGKGVRWAVVQIDGIGGATSDGEQTKLNQQECEFTPRVVIARPDEEMAVLNSDGILHNVHTYSESNPPMNMAQPGFVQTLPVTFAEAEVIKVKCDVHGWMTGWIMVTDNRFAAVTDEAGSFSLDGVPAGKHQLTVWHEKLGEQIREIDVADGGQTEVAIELSAQ
jgi:plastocyanin